MRTILRSLLDSGPIVAFVGLLVWLPATSMLFEPTVGPIGYLPLGLMAGLGAWTSVLEGKKHRWLESALALVPIAMLFISWQFAHPPAL